MADRSVNIIVRLVNGVAAGASAVRSSLARVASQAAAMFRQLRFAGARVWDGLLNIKTLLIGGAVAGIVGKMFKEFANQELIEKRLKKAIELRGQAVDQLFPKYKKFASLMQDQTTVADDAVMAAMDYGLALGIQTDRMEEVTKAAIGMAAMYEGSNIMTNMKALAGVANGINMEFMRLTRTQLTGTNAADNFNTAIKMMLPAFAKAQEETKTLTGAFRQFKNVFGDLFEEIGGQVVRGGKLIQFLHDARDRVKALMDQLEKSGAIERWAARTRVALDKTLALVEKVVGGTDKEREVAMKTLTSNAISALENAVIALTPVIMKVGYTLGEAIVPGIYAGIIQGRDRIITDIKNGVGLGGQSLAENPTQALPLINSVTDKTKMLAGFTGKLTGTGLGTDAAVFLLDEINKKIGKSQEGG